MLQQIIHRQLQHNWNVPCREPGLVEAGEVGLGLTLESPKPISLPIHLGESQNAKEKGTIIDIEDRRRERESVIPKVSQERARRVGIERQIISQDANAPYGLSEACKKDVQGIVHHPEGYSTPAYQETP